jgi:hypothetical protein
MRAIGRLWTWVLKFSSEARWDAKILEPSQYAGLSRIRVGRIKAKYNARFATVSLTLTT